MRASDPGVRRGLSVNLLDPIFSLVFLTDKKDTLNSADRVLLAV